MIIEHTSKESVFHTLSSRNSFLRKETKPLYIPTRLLGKHPRYGKFHPFGFVLPNKSTTYKMPVWKSASCYIMQTEGFNGVIQIKEGRSSKSFIKSGDDINWKHLCEFHFEEDALLFLNARYDIHVYKV